MDIVRELIWKKPKIYIGITVAYVALTVLLKWGIVPDTQILFYAAGAALGIFFLDAAELFFRLDPSPFHSVVFCGLFALVSLFVVTSSGSSVANGLVLSIYLQLILRQLGELRIAGSLSSWYQMVTIRGAESERVLFGVFVLLFILETVFFVR